MAEIVNLRLHRKRKARDENVKRAEQNRSRFGETKTARERRLFEFAKSAKLLDGHHLSSDPTDSDD